MTTLKPFNLFFLAAAVLTPACLYAQAKPDDPSLKSSAPNPPSFQVAHPTPFPTQPRKQRIYSHFFAGANKHPLTPRDVATREAVQSLGVDKHRFVRCDLLDGTSVKGAILSVGQESFQLSHGILQGQRRIFYASLRTPPRPDAAPAEHLVNALQWTGFVAVGIVATPGLFLMGLSCNFSCS